MRADQVCGARRRSLELLPSLSRDTPDPMRGHVPRFYSLVHPSLQNKGARSIKDKLISYYQCLSLQGTALLSSEAVIHAVTHPPYCLARVVCYILPTVVKREGPDVTEVSEGAVIRLTSKDWLLTKVRETSLPHTH